MVRTDGRAGLRGLGVVLGAPTGREAGGAVLDRASDLAGTVEEWGWTSLWVEETSVDPPGQVPYEAYTFLAALAVRGAALHLGVAADGAQRRPPSILAKIVTGLDVISHGRAVLSLDGDTERDTDVGRLRESLEVSRAVLEDDRPVVDGRIYHVDGAVNRPAPVQAGGVPLVVFLTDHGPDLTPLLEVCGEAADAVIVDGGPEGVRRALAVVDRSGSERRRPGSRPLVIGRAEGGTPTAVDVVARVADAGADGCLLTVPAPWSVVGLESLRF